MAKKRKSRNGTVRQRRDGRWEGRIVIGYDDNGFPRRKMFSPKQRRSVRRSCESSRRNGRAEARKVKSDMLFGDWLCYWYENHSKPKIRASTQNNYERRIHNCMSCRRSGTSR